MLQLNVALVQEFVGVNCIWNSGFVPELGVVELQQLMVELPSRHEA